MFRAAIVRALGLGALCAMTTFACAQDFSADVFNDSGKDAAKAGKVYVKGSKMRVDRGDANAEQSAPLVLVDFENHSATIMDTASHAYMKTEVDQEAGLSFFRLKDSNNACADLEKMAGMQSGCKKVGNESVNGRQAVKYAGQSGDGKQVVMWVDPEVNFVVKWQTKTGETGDLRNMKVGAQADSLFELPAGYHNAVKDDTKADDDKRKGDTKEEPAPPPQ